MRPRRYDDASRACGSPVFEALEGRLLLSAGFPPVNGLSAESDHFLQGLSGKGGPHKGVAQPIAIVQSVSPSATAPPTGSVTPAQVRHAYGIDQVIFGDPQDAGAGQTIAIIDAYDYPTAWADLQAFDAYFGLPDPPSFLRVAQDGSTNYPPTDPQKGWELEAALDIEWAHAIAPQANIILVEATDNSFDNLVVNAVNWARSQPGVVAISMSFSGSEFSGETAYDSYFTTPANHDGVTFLAATGDSGRPAGYPAYSPNVVAVGGTTLSLSGSTYVSEAGWSGSGGGISAVEPQPAWQHGVVTQSSTRRTAPDIAMDADPNTGVAVYDSYNYPGSPWLTVGGTSLATPMWAGLIAIVDQALDMGGLGPLDGATQTLPRLYQLPAADFHDITTGNNGYAAATGYDLVTGRGTPVADRLIYGLTGIVGSISGTVFLDNNGNGVRDGGESPMPGVTVYLDANNNGAIDSGGTTSQVSTNVPKSIPDNKSSGVISTLVFSAVGAIADVDVKLSITHTRDSDLTAYLIGPGGTQVTLFARVGGNGANFTNTTFSDQAATSIANGTAPFTGTFRPSPGLLSAFNGQSANGTWTLKVVDSKGGSTGNLTAWSLAIATAGETHVVSGSDGSYSFGGVAAGQYIVREVVPATYVQTGPDPGAVPSGAHAVMVLGPVIGQDFGLFPTVFTASGAGASYYVSLDPTHAYVRISASVAPLSPPTWQIALGLLPGMTFLLQGADNNVYVDFVNGSPIPAGNIVVNASAGTDPTLGVLGQATPQTFTMTDTQIGPTGGPAILYQGLGTLRLSYCTVNYTGSLDTLDMLYIGVGTMFYWN